MPRPQNYGRLLQLFAGENRTPRDAFLLKAASLSATIMFLSQVTYPFFRNSQSAFAEVISIVFVISVVIFFMTFSVLAVVTLGRRAGKTNFLSHWLHFSKKLCLYLFLPAGILTIMAVLYMKFVLHTL